MIFVFDLKSIGHNRLSRLPFWKSEKIQKIFWDCPKQADALLQFVEIANPISDMSILYHRWFEKERFETMESAAKTLDLFHQPFSIDYNSTKCVIKIDEENEKIKYVLRRHDNRDMIWSERPLQDRFVKYSAVNTMLTWRIYLFFTKVRKSELENQEFIDVNNKYSYAHAQEYEDVQASHGRNLETPLLLRLPHTHILLQYSMPYNIQYEEK